MDRLKSKGLGGHVMGLLEGLNHIEFEAARSNDGQRCMVAPSPELRDRIKQELKSIRGAAGSVLRSLVRAGEPHGLGFNDGLIIPPDRFPLGTAPGVIRNLAADRAPLRGVVRVIVVLVDFSDRVMAQTVNHFRDLFFSTGVVPTKSVREYFQDVSNGLIDIQGEVVGPYRMPSTLATYANGASGIGSALPNARTMARDAVLAADPHVNFAPYDNDGNGFVDAFIVVHAGPGGEQTGNPADIWSHKWVLDGGQRTVDGTNIYGYLTVPEDARIGVCCHELGHLLFGFPDLYDTDNTSEGIGNWCLMAGGSWGGGGDTPVHPSAWCKANQGWVSVDNRTSNGTVNIPDVKDSKTVLRLWKDGAPGSEYFLVENRQKSGFDVSLPGPGLLIWHIDDAIGGNTNESHYKVGLLQADGLRQLENDANRGDGGDPYPGTSNNTALTSTSNPNSKSHSGVDTCVAVTGISSPAAVMSAHIQVRCKRKEKELRKEVKDSRKESKELTKEIRDNKIRDKNPLDKRPEKPIIDKAVGFDKGFADKPGDGKLIDGGKLTEGGGQWVGGDLGPLAERVAALEWAVQSLADRSEASPPNPVPEPFIGSELRPDLSQGALLAEEDCSALQQQMRQGSADAKRCYDSKATRR